MNCFVCFDFYEILNICGKKPMSIIMGHNNSLNDYECNIILTGNQNIVTGCQNVLIGI